MEDEPFVAAASFRAFRSKKLAIVTALKSRIVSNAVKLIANLDTVEVDALHWKFDDATPLYARGKAE